MIFSVLVPFLNEELYIKRCIESLLNQDFDKDQYELIFIDNGSTDRSADIVRRFPRVILLKKEKRGTYSARNKGLATARGEIIALIDADCVAPPDWLKQIHEGMSKHSATVALGQRFFPPGISLPLKLFEDYDNAKMEFISTAYPEKFIFGNGNNMAIRTALFKRLGKFLEFPDNGDTEFIYRYFANDAHPAIVYLPYVRINHLEVDRLGIWLGKMHYYGTLVGLSKNVMMYKNAKQDLSNSFFTNRDRWQTYLYCAKKHDYGIAERALLFILLTIGVVYYRVGLVKGRIKASRLPSYTPEPWNAGPA